MFTLLFLSSLFFGQTDSVRNIEDSTVKTSYIGIKKIVKIDGVEVSTFRYSGSGTIIKKDREAFYILSCKHVIPDGMDLTVQVKDKIYPAKVLFFHDEMDLTLIKVDSKDNVVVTKLAKEESYDVTTQCYKAGYPRGGNLVVAYGTCMGRTVLASSVKYPNTKYTSFAAWPGAISGDSGGGVHRKSDGRLIGVIWGSYPTEYRARTISDIRSFLDNNGFKYE